MAGGGQAAPTDMYDLMGVHPSNKEEAVRATLAGIAAELEASDRIDGRSRRIRYALVGGVVVIAVAFFLVARSPRRDYALVGVNASPGAAGEVTTPVAVAPPMLPAAPIATDTTGPLSRKVVAAPRAARATEPEPAVADMAVFPSAVRLMVSRTAMLTATLADDDSNEIVGRHVSWTSNKPKVATVSPKGVVKGRGIGTATITARAGGKKATVLVVVTRQSTKGRR